MPKIFDEPSEVESRSGEVQVEGPDHVSVILTPEAAIRTAARLVTAAAQAIDKAKNANTDGSGSPSLPSA